MKRWFTGLLALTGFALLGATGVQAQNIVITSGGTSAYNGAPVYPLISGFDSIEADTSLWGQYGFYDAGASCANQPVPCWDNVKDRDYLEISDYVGSGYPADMPQGASAMILEWSFFTDQSWGGSSALQHILPDSVFAPETGMGKFYDVSDFTHMNLSYNVLTPATTTTSFRIKTQDASESSPGNIVGHEDWYTQDDVMYTDEVGVWKTLSIPLESLGNVTPGNGGFSRPGCPGSCWSGAYGNGEFDLDKLVGFQLEFTTGQLGAAFDSVTAGTIVWDNFNVSGVRYNTLESFDAGADAGWINSTAGSFTSSVVTDVAEGTGALQIDYNIVGDQGWGGSVDTQGTPDGDNYGSMEARTALSLFYKVLVPASNPNQQLTIKVWDTSNPGGSREEWDFNVYGALNDTSGQWRRLLLPFDSGWFWPSWTAAGDGVLDRNAIVETQIQIYVPEGTTSAGSVIFDRFTGYGFQETDYEAPAAVTGLAASAGDFQNIVSWTDVPGEDGETYAIFASQSPITDVTAANVMPLVTGVAEGTEAYIHTLHYPNTDSNVSLYYAIRATDRVGNVGEATALGSALTNMAKGIPTIHFGTPAGFAADGNLGEWAGITPLHMEQGTMFGFVPATGAYIDPTSAADLSADLYIAMDSDNLYVGISVQDDVVDPYAGTGNQWELDTFEFYFGQWDRNRSYHGGGYNASNEPDTQMSFTSINANSGQVPGWANGLNPVLADDDYEWVRTATGYNIEIVIPFVDFQRAGQPVFTPVEGMLIPIDVSLQDDDTFNGAGNRETLLTLSPNNVDNSYLYPRSWTATWIGNKYSAVGVENVSADVPTEYSLEQNYPNPFNPTTTFRYELKQAGPVTLKVFNILGQEVKSLVDTDQAAGTYEVRFDATGLPSGMYMYQLRSGNFVQSKKMLLVR